MSENAVESEIEAIQQKALVLNEVQLLLAEKRTSLSILRTGLAVLALPMSVTTFLIATSKSYEWLNVWHFLLPLSLLNALLVGLGIYLIVQAVNKLIHYDRIIHRLILENKVLSHLLS
ncbi:MAG TPA: hypothetical protein PLM98_09665 [Thiolinea sp.]|nr:hypothetical protein [Thiolinea sp.]